jgi:large subunit ribosomal protein L10
MKREQKTERVGQLAELLTSNDTFFLFDYNKMTVAQAVALRKVLRKQGSSLKVVKNRLALRALKAEFPESLKAAFKKPTAMACTSADPVVLAKALRDFAVQNKVLVMKGGIVQGRYVPAERFEEITKLASREVLIGKIAIMMAHPLTKLLRTLQAPLVNTVLLLSQLKDKKPQSV